MSSKINIKELVDFVEFQKLMDEFYELTNIPIGVIDVNNDILLATGWQSICTEYHRKHPESCKLCHESDRFLLSHLKEKTHIAYKCKNNLWDIAQPIIIEEEHVATIFLGQFRYEDEISDDKIFIEQARKFGYDKDDYLRALHEIPVFSREKVEKTMKYYTQLANIFTYTGYLNYKLKKELEYKNSIQNELLEAKEKAEESDHLKSAFLQNMSHEIRTPMNAILGFSQMLNNKELSEEKKTKFINVIKKSAGQLMSIVDNVLTISSIETKQERIEHEPVCINNIVIDLFDIFKDQASVQSISLFSKQPLTDKASIIYSDKTKLTQILTNLLSNALKFTHNGYIEFGYKPQKEKLIFHVKDTGIGISQESKQIIFDRFRQVNSAPNKKNSGMGVGLSISKEFVEMLGGEIWLESTINEGTCFYFSIPYKAVHEGLKHTELTQASSPARVLVAEDEEYNFLLIEELLKGLNIELIHAKDGEEAVQLFKENPNIDLFLSDIKMPKMDGHTAACIIKKIRPDLPIIAQTAYALKQDKERFSSSCFNEYITKPLNIKNLNNTIIKYIPNLINTDK